MFVKEENLGFTQYLDIDSDIHRFCIIGHQLRSEIIAISILASALKSLKMY